METYVKHIEYIIDNVFRKKGFLHVKNITPWFSFEINGTLPFRKKGIVLKPMSKTLSDSDALSMIYCKRRNLHTVHKYFCVFHAGL